MGLRRLILMRHAESPWEGVQLPDHQRPLGERGHQQATRTGSVLAARGWIPDIVLSSDAKRTRETFAGLSQAFEKEVDVRFLSSFYHNGVAAAEEEVVTLPDGAGCVLLLGHNPGWELLVERLTGKAVAMEPATAAVMGQDLESWKDAGPASSWELEEVLFSGSR